MGAIKVERLTDEQKQRLLIPPAPQNKAPWSVWECPPSTFDWTYDSVERAYVYEGRVRVKTSQEEVEIKAGDYVTFPKGLSCTWQVLQKIRKVYKFE